MEEFRWGQLPGELEISFHSETVSSTTGLHHNDRNATGFIQTEARLHARSASVQNKIRHALKAQLRPELFPVRSFHAKAQHLSQDFGIKNLKEKNHTQKAIWQVGRCAPKILKHANLLSLTRLRTPIGLGHRGATVRTADQFAVDMYLQQNQDDPGKVILPAERLKAETIQPSGRLREVKEFSRHQHLSADETVAAQLHCPEAVIDRFPEK